MSIWVRLSVTDKIEANEASLSKGLKVGLMFSFVPISDYIRGLVRRSVGPSMGPSVRQSHVSQKTQIQVNLTKRNKIQQNS